MVSPHSTGMKVESYLPVVQQAKRPRSNEKEAAAAASTEERKERERVRSVGHLKTCLTQAHDKMNTMKEDGVNNAV